MVNVALSAAQHSWFPARTRQVSGCHAPQNCIPHVNETAGKAPLGVIEVDGGSHDEAIQIKRDQLKNSILEKCSIPILRLRTIESNIEERVIAFLAASAGSGASPSEKH